MAIIIGIAIILLAFTDRFFLVYENWKSKSDYNKYIEQQRCNFYVYDGMLKQHFDYYRKLSTDEQERFICRMCWFKKNKIWLCPPEFKIGDKEMVLISAAAVQLTFGLQKFLLPHFAAIIVHPDIYYSERANDWLKGLANQDGSVELAWKWFQSGIENSSDDLNLGLHEMAHALHYQNFIVQEEYQEYFVGYYNDWLSTAQDFFTKQHELQERKYFRDYAFTNMEEFWAVTVEYFFETPIAFRQVLPELYNKMCYVLNQNPAEGVTRVMLN